MARATFTTCNVLAPGRARAAGTRFTNALHEDTSQRIARSPAKTLSLAAFVIGASGSGLARLLFRRCDDVGGEGIAVVANMTDLPCFSVAAIGGGEPWEKACEVGCTEEGCSGEGGCREDDFFVSEGCVKGAKYLLTKASATANDPFRNAGLGRDACAGDDDGDDDAGLVGDAVPVRSLLLSSSSSSSSSSSLIVPSSSSLYWLDRRVKVRCRIDLVR